MSTFSTIPQELLPSMIPRDSLTLRRASQVCHAWKEVCDALWEKVIIRELDTFGFSSRIFGPREWKKYHKITIQATYPRKMLDLLEAPSPFFKGKTVGETSYIHCKSKEVDNGQKLADLMTSKKGYNGKPPVDLSEEKAGSAHDWIIVPDHIIRDSTNKVADDQITLVKSLDSTYREATIFEISLIAFNHYIQTGHRLLSHDPYEYTRCLSTNKGSHCIIGAYLENGLKIIELNTNMKNTGMIPIKDLT